MNVKQHLKRILCSFGQHDWSEWKATAPLSRWVSSIPRYRICHTCKIVQSDEGIFYRNITNDA